jgi:DNA-3-methyladenine glycosylase
VAGVGGRAGGATLNPDLAALLAGPVVPAARGLLGCWVVAGGVTVRLTEVEAYAGVGEDPGSHAHRGRTPRNAVMFGLPGHLYVYFTYGMHWCLNVVCRPEGEAAAVLLRAGEVVDGVAPARARRGPARPDRDLARGPARLATALGIDGAANGVPLLHPAGPVRLAAPVAPPDPARVRSGPRVGVNGGAEVPWRFWLEDEPTVSPYRRHPLHRPGQRWPGYG